MIPVPVLQDIHQDAHGWLMCDHKDRVAAVKGRGRTITRRFLADSRRRQPTQFRISLYRRTGEGRERGELAKIKIFSFLLSFSTAG